MLYVSLSISAVIVSDPGLFELFCANTACGEFIVS